MDTIEYRDLNLKYAIFISLQLVMRVTIDYIHKQRFCNKFLGNNDLLDT